jgi:MHS family alpha-ketoglutarate permease-like MFS transporter
MSAPSQPTTGFNRRTTTTHRKTLVAVSLGNILEWFDWLIFAQLAAVISVQFFPADDPGTALLNTLVVFGVGFFFRPLGGVVLTALSDRAGRKVGLIVTMSLIAGGALLIGIAPTYSQVGIVAPILLVVARAMQGLSTGGEGPSVATYLAEAAPPGRRGIYGSLNYVTATIGSITATGCVLLLRELLTSQQLSDWGWRIPFLLGAVVGLVVLYLRRHMTETEVFRESVSTTGAVKSPIRELFRHHASKTVVLFILSGLTGIWYYTFASYLPAYLAGQGMDNRTSLVASIISLSIFAISLPFVGILSDRIGRRLLLLTFCGLAAAAVVPIFALLETTFIHQIVLQTTALLIFSLFGAVGFVTMAEQFPTSVRTVGVGLPYALGVALFGGTAPYVLESLAARGAGSAFPWYIAALAVASFIATLSIRNRHTESLSATP